jgi:hypothetical protein
MTRSELPPLTAEYLREELRKQGVPVDTWGIDTPKTVESLITEIEEGAGTLIRGEKGELIRVIQVVALSVTYLDGRTWYRLEEDRQEFTDGRSTNRNLSTSLGEKLNPGETPEEGARRALREELGLDNVDTLLFTFGTPQNIERSSPSYPGLPTQMQLHPGRVQLRTEHYKAEGYTEVKGNRTTHFSWRILSEASHEQARPSLKLR